jgi:hypothetical protein
MNVGFNTYLFLDYRYGFNNSSIGKICAAKCEEENGHNIQDGPDITCQKFSGSLEGSNKTKKPLFVRSKIMGIN